MDGLTKEQKAIFDSGDFQHREWEWNSDISIDVECVPNDGSESFWVEYVGDEISDMGMDYVFDNMSSEELEEFDRQVSEREKK